MKPNGIPLVFYIDWSKGAYTTVLLIYLGAQFPSSVTERGIAADGGISPDFVKNFSGLLALTFRVLMSLMGLGIWSLSIFFIVEEP